jgi:hypothetical protein
VIRRTHRQPAQTFVIAALAMTSMLGALSMVIDAGVYFVIQRQLQNAADAAALAAVWYDPACPSPNPAWVTAGCQLSNPDPTPPECLQPQNSAYSARPCTAAVNQVKANWGIALSLCAGPDRATGSVPIKITANPGLPPSGSLNVPQVSPYFVSLECVAPHWFARALPLRSDLLYVTINASAAAALGWLDNNGQLLGGSTIPVGTPGRLVARLLI